MENISLKCGICNNIDTKILFKKNGFNFVTCRYCNLVFVSPQLGKDSVDQIYNDLGEKYYPLLKSIFKSLAWSMNITGKGQSVIAYARKI